jgi:putative ABC transport system permease protein
MLSEFGRRLLMLLRRRQFDADLEEEMRLHRELRVQEQIERGLSEKEARYAVQRRFGNDLVLREESRDMWGWNWLESFLQDVRYGLRVLARNPGFTAVAVITLALGIGANTAIFTVVNAVLLRPLPYEKPDQLVAVFESEPECRNCPVSGPDFLDWRQSSKSFSSLVAGTMDQASLTGAGEPQHLDGADVSPGIFELLGAPPALGRTFTSDEERGVHYVVIISYGLWQRAFGGNRSLVGKRITLDGKEADVIGIMPKGFQFPRMWGNPDPDFWVPLPVDALNQNRGSHWLWVLGRLRPGVAQRQAQAEMTGIAGQIAQQYRESNAGVGASVVDLHEELVGDTRPMLLLLFSAVGFLLLIAGANVANLLLAQAARRQREMAVRLAVGAGRWRLARQLLTESVGLASLGGAAGLLLAVCAKASLVSLAPPRMLPSVNPINLDARVFVFALAVCLLVGILFGLAPALGASRIDLDESLKEGARGFTGGLRARRFRGGLVVCEVGLALVLLIGGGLLIHSLKNLVAVDIGFNPKNVLTMELNLPSSRYPKNEDRLAFFQNAVERVKGLPGVLDASVTSKLPLMGMSNNGDVWVEGRPMGPEFQGPLVEFSYVLPGYFHTLGVPSLVGRTFAFADGAGAPRVAVINETLARHFWPHESPLGKRFTRSKPPQWVEVVGVVADVRQSWRLADPPMPEAYFPYAQWAEYDDLYLVVRSALDPASLIQPVRAQLLNLDPDLPAYHVETMEQIRTARAAAPRFRSVLMTLFALVALTLAATGIYGVMAYAVTERTHEIGVRMALGAVPRDVLRMVVSQGMALTLAGVAAGLAGAFALTRFLASFLYGVLPTDPGTFVGASLLLVGVATLACYIPARRATKVDTLVALRYE